MSETPLPQDPQQAADTFSSAEDAAGAAPETAAQPLDPAALAARVAELETELAAKQDAWLRAVAEADNIRRRSAEEVLKAGKFAVEKFSLDLVAVKDSLEAAIAANGANASLENLASGVELTLKQLVSAFDKAGVTEVNPVGEKFDPHRHQAVGMVPADQEPNTVVNVLQKGYVLNDRVLRPAMVTVAQG